MINCNYIGFSVAVELAVGYFVENKYNLVMVSVVISEYVAQRLG